MSMDQAPENNLPPGTGLRLGGDWTRERDALRKQVQECEFDVAVLQAWCAQLERIGVQLHPAEWHEIAALAQSAPLLPEGTALPASFTQVAGVRALQAAYEQAESARVRVTDQWQQAEAHNNDVNADLAAVRTWAQATQRAATNRLAQGSPDPRYWQGQTDAAAAVWALVKPVV